MSDLKAASTQDGGAIVSVKVKNNGNVAGDAVPQVYLQAPASQPDGIQFAPKTLAAFDRVTLQPGEEQELTLQIAPRAFQYWSTKTNSWVKPDGPRTVLVGNSSRDLPLSAEVN
jgi:beta-glucosidase